MITLVAMFFISIAVMGQTSPKKVAVAKDSINSITTVDADSASYKTISADDEYDNDCNCSTGFFDHGFNFHNDFDDLSVAIFALLCVFGLPILIIFVVLYFRHKDKKAHLQMVEKALENGREVPQELLKKCEEEPCDYSQGIKKIALGFGLTIFFWAITGRFAIACIGILMIFIGLGQVISQYVNRSSKRK